MHILFKARVIETTSRLVTPTFPGLPLPKQVTSCTLSHIIKIKSIASVTRQGDRVPAASYTKLLYQIIALQLPHLVAIHNLNGQTDRRSIMAFLSAYRPSQMHLHIRTGGLRWRRVIKMGDSRHPASFLLTFTPPV
jgi:hypothetical protein